MMRSRLRSKRTWKSTDIAPAYRPVTIVDASEPKKLDLRVAVPVEDMARLDEMDTLPSGAAMPSGRGHSIPERDSSASCWDSFARIAPP